MSRQLFHFAIASVFVLLLSMDQCSVQAATGAETGEASEKVTRVFAGSGVRLKARSGSGRLDNEDDILESPQLRFRRGQGRVTFLYRDENYESVAVAGSFNSWDPDPMELDSVDGVWTLRIDLEPGRYLYRFIVRDEDGEWEAIDPNNDNALRDSELGWVSRFRVREKRRFFRSRYSHTRYSKQELNRLYGEEGIGIDYQRVDGLFLYVAPGAYARHSFGTSLKGKIGYGFKSEEWSVSATMAQPLSPSGRLQVMLTGYDETTYTDQTGIGDLENMLAAVLFKKDFRDYYRRKGFSARLVFKPHRYLRLVGGFRTDDYSTLSNRASWSLGSGGFLPNPPVHEGTMRSVFGEVQVGSELRHLRVNYETCGEYLAGGDFEFDQLTAQVRHRSNLGPDKCFDWRVKYGTTLSGWLPNQRRYLAGGLGTVRGYDYQSLLIAPVLEPGVHGGQQLFLANAELKLDFNLDWGWAWFWDWDWDDDWDTDFDFDLAIFFDTGMAWAEKDADVDFRELKSSAGVGFLFGDDDGIRLDIIQVLDESDKDLVFQIRINRMF